MDKNGQIPWSCLAPGGARKAEIWHTSDETAVLARRLAAASPAILAASYTFTLTANRTLVAIFTANYTSRLRT
jgi:hypothetical protein